MSVTYPLYKKGWFLLAHKHKHKLKHEASEEQTHLFFYVVLTRNNRDISISTRKTNMSVLPGGVFIAFYLAFSVAF